MRSAELGLALAQRGLGLFALGDVGDDAVEADEARAGGAVGDFAPAAAEDPAHGAVGLHDAVLLGVGVGAQRVQRRLDGFHHPVAVVLVDAAGGLGEADLCGVQAPDLPEAGVGVDAGAVRGDVPGAEGGGVQGEAQAAFALAQGVLGVAGVGDVLHGAGKAVRFEPGRPLAHGGAADGADPARGAAGPEDAVGAIVELRAVGVQRSAKGGSGAVAVVGVDALEQAVVVQHAVGRDAEHGLAAGVEVEHAGGGVEGPRAEVGGGGGKAEALAGGGEGGLGLALVVDVGAGAEPAHDGALLVALREGLSEKPAVGAVVAAEAVLDGVRLAGLERVAPDAEGALLVVGVEDVVPALASGFFDREAGVGVPARVVVVVVSSGVGDPDELGDGVGEGAEVGVLSRARRLGLVALVDVGVGADPFGDGAGGVAERHGAGGHPAVGAVVAAEAVLGLVRRAGSDGGLPGGARGGAVVGVDGDEPALAPVVLPRLPGKRLPVGRRLFLEPRRPGGPDHRRGGAHEQAVAGLAAAQHLGGAGDDDGLADGFLGVYLSRHVVHHHHGPERAAVARAELAAASEEVARGEPVRRDLHRRALHGLACEGAPQRDLGRLHRRAVAAAQAVGGGPLIGVEPRVRREAVEALGGVVEERQPAVGVAGHDAGLHVLQHGREKLALPLELGLDGAGVARA